MVAVISSIASIAYAIDGGGNGKNLMMPKACGWSCGQRCVLRIGGFVDVSNEFEENVINIAKSDSDVQKLLADGYNITGVRPIIKAKVVANGDVTIKATGAIIMLKKDRTSYATVLIDLEVGKVTQVVTLTRTVIKKS
jgi:hypothetical protein